MINCAYSIYTVYTPASQAVKLGESCFFAAFDRAYVIAHELGHHVQTLLGISTQVRAAQQKASTAEANLLSVKQELQADCFAGLWGHHANMERALLEEGDLEEALAAASAIGDDRLQQQSQGHVTPDSFTHGSSEQRARWFKKGFASGSVEACDTFTQLHFNTASLLRP